MQAQKVFAVTHRGLSIRFEKGQPVEFEIIVGLVRFLDRLRQVRVEVVGHGASIFGQPATRRVSSPDPLSRVGALVMQGRIRTCSLSPWTKGHAVPAKLHCMTLPVVFTQVPDRLAEPVR